MDMNQLVLAGHVGGGDTGSLAGSGNSFSERFPTHLGDMDLNQQSVGNMQAAPGTKGLKSMLETVGSLSQSLNLNQVGQLMPPPTPFAGKIPGGLVSSRGA